MKYNLESIKQFNFLQDIKTMIKTVFAVIRQEKRMEKGLVSVITPTYNCARFIEETIESVLAQTYQQWEMIIVDDCSTDNTREVVGEYIKKDNRIKYFCLENNSGAAVARTKAMELANGQYMAFLDSDDIWSADKLKKQQIGRAHV